MSHEESVLSSSIGTLNYEFPVTVHRFQHKRTGDFSQNFSFEHPSKLKKQVLNCTYPSLLSRLISHNTFHKVCSSMFIHNTLI